LPVIDDNRTVVGLHVWNALQTPASRPNVMIVMAGGKGMRLRPHTESCPKPLLPVGGKPMLEHIIERAKSDGFRTFVIAVNYLGHMIEDYFGDGGKWGVSISYLREETPLGTGGALSLLSPRPAAPIIVTNGDVLTDIRYSEVIEFHQRHEAAATMAVRSHEWQHPFGVVRARGVDIVGFEEKPIYRSHVNAGIYAIEPRALELLNAGERCDMPTLFERLQEASERTIVYPMHEPWLDVGRQDDLEKARDIYNVIP
jgi:NDP-sugar pyrophosphorylase family protein